MGYTIQRKTLKAAGKKKSVWGYGDTSARRKIRANQRQKDKDKEPLPPLAPPSAPPTGQDYYCDDLAWTSAELVARGV